MSGNHMVGLGDDCPEERDIPVVSPYAAHCYVCGFPYDTRAGCLECERRAREAARELAFDAPSFEEVNKWMGEAEDDWTTCDFCGEPVRVRHFCQECSRFCEEKAS